MIENSDRQSLSLMFFVTLNYLFFPAEKTVKKGKKDKKGKKSVSTYKHLNAFEIMYLSH